MRNSCQYRIAGPRTFRLASSMILPKKIYLNGKTVKKGWGSNLQNVEKSMREGYEPNGYSDLLYDKCKYYMESGDSSIFSEEELLTLRIFVQVDQSGAEALITAYCCEPAQYRELFKNNIKPHSFLGMHIFREIWPDKMRQCGVITGSSDFDINELCNCSISQLKMHPFWKPLDNLIKDSDDWPLTERYYYLAKQAEHSSNYDIQPPTFRLNVLEKSGGKIVISKEDSEKYLMTKFALFPEIKGYHRWVQSLATKNKILYNLHGHPYCITHYEILDSHLKELYSWIPQATVGEITNIAFTRMHNYIRDTGKRWDVLQNNHDSYLIQCPIGEELECSVKAKEFIEQGFVSPIDGAKFNMRSEAQYGFTWSPFKKAKNELGLRKFK